MNSAAAGAGAAGKNNAISNDVTDGNRAAFTAGNGGVLTSNPDRIIAEINRLLEPITQTCNKLPGRLKSYYSQLLLRIPQDLREELTRDNDTRKRKRLPTVEEKIDNSLTLLVSIYNRLNQLEDAMLTGAPRQGKDKLAQSANGKFAKSKIIVQLQSAWSSVQRLWAKRLMRRYRNPYILCAVVIYFLYFVLSIFSWQQWHRYRDENTHLRLAADKYRVDSMILHETYPQATGTLSTYEHITEAEGADAAIEVFREDIDKTRKQKTSATQ